MLMAAAQRPADVLGDHGRAAGRSHSLPFAPRPHVRPCGASTFLVQAWLTAGNPVSRAAQYLCGKTQYCPVSEEPRWVV
jgi:hypothetical protein